MKSIYFRKSLQQGLTLIEVLVSITIGLVILAALGVVFANSNNTNRQQEDQTEINEPSRNLISSLRREISNAGYIDAFGNVANAIASTRNLQGISTFDNQAALVNIYQRVPRATPLPSPITTLFPGLFPVMGCDGAMLSLPNTIATAGNVPPGVFCGPNTPLQQTLQLAYQAVPAAGTTTSPLSSLQPANPATGSGQDCLSQNTLGSQGVVINRYFIQAGTDGTNELRCAGSGNAISQPIVRGVEEFVVRYQLSQPGVTNTLVASGGSPAQYVNATAVALDPLGWSAVTGVEVCFIIATPQVSGPAAKGVTALQTARPTCQRNNAGQFNPDIARTAGDLRLWKRFTTTSAVKNAIYAGVN
jgi:type IV pilus assembly protein PilW